MLSRHTGIHVKGGQVQIQSSVNISRFTPGRPDQQAESPRTEPVEKGQQVAAYSLRVQLDNIVSPCLPYQLQIVSLLLFPHPQEHTSTLNCPAGSITLQRPELDRNPCRAAAERARTLFRQSGPNRTLQS